MTRSDTGRYYRSPIAKLAIRRVALKPDFATVRCHGCGEPMTIRIDPARLWIGITYVLAYPCLQAPYLCTGCHADRVRLDKARKAMEAHFGGCGGGREPETIEQTTGGQAA